MPARSPKKSELRNLAGRRRTGRPRTATAAARIYAELRAELVSLQRRPGDPIVEAEIARSYGVSRTPVREAILRLSDEGLVEIFPQSGIFVSRIPLAALPEAIIVRRSLEETTTRMATERASASQILGLHAILERQREAQRADDRESFHQADEAFHAAIAEIAGHPGIWKLILQVKVHVDRFRWLTLPQRGRMAEVIAEHEAVMAAMEARDPAAAGAAMTRHLERLLADIAATQHNNPEFFDEQRQPA
ncbi:GntR family transcriptional regulator [Bradyrhizobium macuxiense]|uniref:GntR family transcriptional regulator n=1 Tax=Bradyrhizobium macuxiense TaxID=1755647 RepID=A0A560LUI1_9BRAD|nr:GntR family transcriptional regulator [Bradyrhizobium macuxiense]TWB96900.1 GntR family transcriptional regulator [Bradyrhizobium macuxiense]